MTEEKEKKSGQGNTPLSEARRRSNDEFYTRRKSVEDELQHYRPHFADKIVYCNCDDPKVSQFFNYFRLNFQYLGLKRLITTCYKNQNADIFSPHDCERAVCLEYDGVETTLRVLQGDGDFRSRECVDLLRQADIVVTNPPFSLFREYVPQLVAEDKKFLIIGNKNAISYKEIFRLIMAEKLLVGYTPMGADMLFDVPPHFAEWLKENKQEGSSYKIVDGEVKGRASAIWFTNLDENKHDELILTAEYGDGSAYPKYDNYDAINVNRVADIPHDYAGVMGVPISFLGKWNLKQFAIVGQMATTKIDEFNFGYPYINGKKKFARILIKRKGA